VAIVFHGHEHVCVPSLRRGQLEREGQLERDGKTLGRAGPSKLTGVGMYAIARVLPGHEGAVILSVVGSNWVESGKGG